MQPAETNSPNGILPESEIVCGTGYGIPPVASVPGPAPPSGQVFLIKVNLKWHYPVERILEGLPTYRELCTSRVLLLFVLII